MNHAGNLNRRPTHRQGRPEGGADNVERAIRRRGWGGDENGRHGPSVYFRGRQRQARSLEDRGWPNVSGGVSLKLVLRSVRLFAHEVAPKLH